MSFLGGSYRLKQLPCAHCDTIMPCAHCETIMPAVRWSDLEWRRFPKDLFTKHRDRVDKLTYESMSWYFVTDENGNVVADDFWYFFCPACTEIVREEYKTLEGSSIAILVEDWIANHPPSKPDRRPPRAADSDLPTIAEGVEENVEGDPEGISDAMSTLAIDMSTSAIIERGRQRRANSARNASGGKS